MHKISWLLNEQLGFDFRRLDETEENSEKKNFSVYQHESNNASFSLIENKSKDGLLLKKLDNIDYLLKIEGALSNSELDNLQKQIRQTSGIYACLIIELSVLKKKELDLLA